MISSVGMQQEQRRARPLLLIRHQPGACFNSTHRILRKKGMGSVLSQRDIVRKRSVRVHLSKDRLVSHSIMDQDELCQCFLAPRPGLLQRRNLQTNGEDAPSSNKAFFSTKKAPSLKDAVESRPETRGK